jgi:hypothetical protein
MSILLVCVVLLAVLAVSNKVRRGSFAFWQRKGRQNW